jgi:glycosyltransferase involved in cell wall biosynthesis
MDPAVSVLLPVRDARPWLEGCLRSLHRQTLRDFEVVAVDDGSRDGSPRILEAWARRDERLRVISTPPRGLVAALNTGLAACRAPLVARMDADDAAHPKRLELQAAVFAREPRVDVVSCGVRHVPVHGVGEGLRRYEAWLNGLGDHEAVLRERFVESPIAHPAAMARRRSLGEVGGWRDPGWPEDYDLWRRLAEAGAVFANVPRVLYFWRDHGRRLTRRDPRYSREAFLRAKAHFLARGPLRKASRTLVWGAGPTGRRLARALEGEGVRPAAFVDIDPSLWSRMRRGLPVVPPEELAAWLVPGTVVLAAVSSRGARELIRARLAAMGLVEGADFWCCA